MNYADVRKLVKLVESSKIQELEIEEEGSRIRVSKGYGDEVVVQAAPQAVQMAAPVAAAAPAPAATPAPAEAPVAEPGKKYHEIKSPMVGTYYSSPAPDADPFAKVGMTVSVGQTLCIVEAMKLMNEIESDVAGKIVSIDIENATPVEFGQVLVKIDTAG